VRTFRRWFFHPWLSLRCALLVDLFPQRSHAEVWALVIQSQRAAVLNRVK
jgi:hypothetical protein